MDLRLTLLKYVFKISYIEKLFLKIWRQEFVRKFLIFLPNFTRQPEEIRFLIKKRVHALVNTKSPNWKVCYFHELMFFSPLFQ